MCKVRVLRTLVKQRLDVAVEEIFELFERTIAEYEEELSRSQEEKKRQRQLLDALLNPHVRLQRAEVQQVLAESQEEVPLHSEQQQEEDPAEPAHIKKEEEDVCINPRREEAKIGSSALNVPVKSEDDEVPAQSRAEPPSTNDLAPLSDVDDATSSDTDNSDDDRKVTTKTKSKGDKTHQNNQNKFKCIECGETFAHKGCLKIHMIAHAGERSFASSSCAKGFFLKRHTKLSQKDPAEGNNNSIHPFTCSECGKTFLHTGNLNRHKRIHTGEKPYACSICGKRFRDKCGVIKHRVVHTGEKPFSCLVCAMLFPHRASLLRHLKKHSGENHFTCTVCTKSCSSLSSFILHSKEHTPSTSSEIATAEAYAQEVCDVAPPLNKGEEKPNSPETDTKEPPKTYPQPKDAERFCCPQCGKTFRHRSYFICHLRTHAGNRPYKCSLCPKDFSRRCDMKVHIRVKHTGETPFACPICGKGFAVKKYMTLHMRRHSGEKRFACPLCSKQFTAKAGMVKHMGKPTCKKTAMCAVDESPARGCSKITRVPVTTGEATGP